MGYYLQVDLHDPEPLASISGLGDLRDWINGLHFHQSRALRHLLEYGWEEDLPELRVELAASLSQQPPGSADVQATAENLGRLLKEARTVVSITDGMGP